MPTHRDLEHLRVRRSALPRITAGIAVGMAFVTGGCGVGGTPAVVPSDGPVTAAPETPAERLIGLVATAKDKRYTATYLLRVTGRSTRELSVQLARDGSWRFDIPGGAHGGARDVTLAATGSGIFQCGLTGERSCARIAGPGHRIPARYDPVVEHPFTDWLDVLNDSRAPLSVARDTRLRVPSGECFSVEPNAVALAPPIPPGTYCFDREGVITGARFRGRTLILTGRPGNPPKSVELPGPVIAGEPLATSPPPRPTASASPSRSG